MDDAARPVPIEAVVTKIGDPAWRAFANDVAFTEDGRHVLARHEGFAARAFLFPDGAPVPAPTGFLWAADGSAWGGTPPSGPCDDEVRAAVRTASGILRTCGKALWLDDRRIGRAKEAAQSTRLATAPDGGLGIWFVNAYARRFDLARGQPMGPWVFTPMNSMAADCRAWTCVSVHHPYAARLWDRGGWMVAATDADVGFQAGLDVGTTFTAGAAMLPSADRVWLHEGSVVVEAPDGRTRCELRVDRGFNRDLASAVSPDGRFMVLATVPTFSVVDLEACAVSVAMAQSFEWVVATQEGWLSGRYGESLSVTADGTVVPVAPLPHSVCPDRAKQAAHSSDGKQWVCVRDDRQITVHGADGIQFEWTAPGPVTRIVFSAGTLWVLNAGGGVIRRVGGTTVPIEGPFDGVDSLALVGGPDYLVAAGSTEGAVFDLDGRRRSSVDAVSSGISSMVAAPEGHRVAVVAGDSLVIIELDDALAVLETTRWDTGQLRAVAAAWRGSELGVVGLDGTFLILDTEKLE